MDVSPAERKWGSATTSHHFGEPQFLTLIEVQELGAKKAAFNLRGSQLGCL